MRTVKELSKMDGRVYVFVKDESIRKIFLQDAENEGFTFGDQVLPTDSEYSCGSKSRIRKFGNRSSGTRKSSFLCLITVPFLWEYLSRPCRICGA